MLWPQPSVVSVGCDPVARVPFRSFDVGKGRIDLKPSPRSLTDPSDINHRVDRNADGFNATRVNRY